MLFAGISPPLHFRETEGTADGGSGSLHVETSLVRISADEIFVSCVSAKILSHGTALSVKTSYTHVRNELTITFTLLADDVVSSRMRAALLPPQVRPLSLPPRDCLSRRCWLWHTSWAREFSAANSVDRAAMARRAQLLARRACYFADSWGPHRPPRAGSVN